MLLIQALGMQRPADICESEANVVYRERSSSATARNETLCLQRKNKENKIPPKETQKEEQRCGKGALKVTILKA